MIKKIRIQNFKSIKDVTVTLSPMTVLIGKSGAGKSNFVEAIRFLRDFILYKHQSNSWQNDLNNLYPASLPLGNAKIEIEINYLVKFNFNYQLCFAYTGEWRIIEEKLSMDNTIYFHKTFSKWEVKPNIAGLPEIPRNFLALNEISGIQEISIANIALTRGIGCYDFPSNILSYNEGDNSSFAGFADRGNNYLNVMKSILNNIELLDNWIIIKTDLNHLDNSIKNIDLKRTETKNLIISHEYRDNIVNLEINRESEGIRRFLANLIALYQHPTKQTLLFEEPEKGIYLGAFGLLVDEYKQFIETNKGQIIIVSHSPNLLDHFEPESIRVVEMVDGETKIDPLDPMQVENIQERLMTTGGLLTTDIARRQQD